MKVKDVKPILERKRSHFSDLQHLESKLQNDSDFTEKLNELCGTSNILQSIREARMSFYDHEVLALEKKIDEAEIQEDL